jgi:hypothetical protein
MTHAVVSAFTIPPGKRALLFFLLGLIGGFGGARLYAHLNRATGVRWLRSIRRGDVHVHHVVYGVVIMIVSGALTFALASDTDWRSFLAFCFGGGTGMVLDEFALILHLEDVYWAEAGRKSIDVAVVTAAFTLMGLVGDDGKHWLITTALGVNLLAVVATSLKGKRLLAAIGVFLPPLAFVGAFTLARPDSPWARRLYPDGSAKLAKAQERARKAHARRRRLPGLIPGAPANPPEG